MASILKVDTIQDQSGNNIINESADTITIGASGDTITIPTGASLTVPSGGLTGQNYPAFQATLSSDQSVTNEVTTKLEADTELFDTDNCYDNVTNYRFTPNVAGKYLVYTMFGFDSTANDTNVQQQIRLYKNTTEVARSWQILTSDERLVVMSPSFVQDMNGTTDYLELFGFISALAGSTTKFYRDTWWGAYRIGD